MGHVAIRGELGKGDQSSADFVRRDGGFVHVNDERDSKPQDGGERCFTV